MQGFKIDKVIDLSLYHQIMCVVCSCNFSLHVLLKKLFVQFSVVMIIIIAVVISYFLL